MALGLLQATAQLLDLGAHLTLEALAALLGLYAQLLLRILALLDAANVGFAFGELPEGRGHAVDAIGMVLLDQRFVGLLYLLHGS